MRIPLRVGLCGWVVLACAGPVHADALITPEEALASQSAVLMQLVDDTPANPQGPLITVVDAQALTQVVKNPFSMEIELQAQRDAEVNFASFKAFYGAFKIDITERLLKQASRTLSGLKIAQVQIPSGRHTILLRVSDTRGRSAEKEIAFRVE